MQTVVPLVNSELAKLQFINTFKQFKINLIYLLKHTSVFWFKFILILLLKILHYLLIQKLYFKRTIVFIVFLISEDSKSPFT